MVARSPGFYAEAKFISPARTTGPAVRKTNMLPLRTILWPTDFSDPSSAALASATELAEHFEARLLCLHVLELPPENSEWKEASNLNIPLSVRQDRDRLQEQLEEFVATHCPDRLSTSCVVVVGDAAPGILKLARQESVDLIVIATHGRTGWRRLVFGSVAEKVIRDADCAVLSIREKDNGTNKDETKGEK